MGLLTSEFPVKKCETEKRSYLYMRSSWTVVTNEAHMFVLISFTFKPSYSFLAQAIRLQKTNCQITKICDEYTDSKSLHFYPKFVLIKGIIYKMVT